MKALSKKIALILAAVSAFSLAGCSKKNMDSRVATTANWNARISTIVENNYVDYWKTHREVATYSISATVNESSSYTVNYDTQTAAFSTKFYMEEYDWQNTGIPESYRSETALKDDVYVYETELLMSGAYKIKDSADEKKFSDKLVTVCKFRLAGENLKPVYSKQTVVNTAPNTLGTSDINFAYVETDGIFETYYNRDCSHATVNHTDNIAKREAEKDGKQYSSEIKSCGISNPSGYSVFDNSQIRAAIRAFTLNGGSSRTFMSFSPQDCAAQVCSVSVANPAELNAEDANQKQIIDALKACTPDDYIFFDGTPATPAEGEEPAAERTYRYTAVSSYLNSSMSGPSASTWYSTVENPDINGTRCVLLKLAVTLPFALGTADYTLKTLNVEKI